MTEDQHEKALDLLEGRRLAIDASMWQAPTLTLVAQVFLLQVLTNGAVRWAVAISVAVAGVAASVTAMFALWQLHFREREFSKRVTHHASKLGISDPTRRRRDCKLHALEWKG